MFVNSLITSIFVDSNIYLTTSEIHLHLSGHGSLYVLLMCGSRQQHSGCLYFKDVGSIFFRNWNFRDSSEFYLTTQC